MKEFIFYYFMKDEKELIQKSAPKHASYWHSLKLSGGPFTDFSVDLFVLMPKINKMLNQS